jgi:hypothetical protein
MERVTVAEPHRELMFRAQRHQLRAEVGHRVSFAGELSHICRKVKPLREGNNVTEPADFRQGGAAQRSRTVEIATRVDGERKMAQRGGARVERVAAERRPGEWWWCQAWRGALEVIARFGKLPGRADQLLRDSRTFRPAARDRP